MPSAPINSPVSQTDFMHLPSLTVRFLTPFAFTQLAQMVLESVLTVNTVDVSQEIVLSVLPVVQYHVSPFVPVAFPFGTQTLSIISRSFGPVQAKQL